MAELDGGDEVMVHAEEETAADAGVDPLAVSDARIIDAPVRSMRHAIERLFHGAAAQEPLRIQPIRPDDPAGVGETHQTQLEVLLESLEGSETQPKVQAAAKDICPDDAASQGSPHVEGRQGVERQGTGDEAAAFHLPGQRQSGRDDGNILAHVEGKNHGQTPFRGKAGAAGECGRRVQSPGRIGFEIARVIDQSGLELGPMAPGFRLPNQPVLHILVEQRVLPVVHAHGNVLIVLPGIQYTTDPGQIVGYPPLQVQRSGQLMLGIGIEGDAVLAVCRFPAVQIGIVWRDCAVEPVEPMQWIVHVLRVGRYPHVPQQVLRIIIQRKLFRAARVDAGHRHYFVPIVGIIRSVPIMIQLAERPELEPQVIVVPERRQEADVPAGLDDFFLVGLGQGEERGQQNGEEKEDAFHGVLRFVFGTKLRTRFLYYDFNR